MMGESQVTKKFYYQLMGEEIGPVSGPEVIGLAEHRTIGPETLIREGITGEWVYASRIGGLKRIFEQPSVCRAQPPEDSIAPPPPRPPVPQPIYPDTADEESLSQLLKQYVGEMVGVNHSDPAKVEPATLVAVNADFFSVQIPDGLLCHFPLRMVLSVTTGSSGGSVQTGGFFSKREYQVVIQVYHMVIYTGAVGVSFEM